MALLFRRGAVVPHNRPSVPASLALHRPVTRPRTRLYSAYEDVQNISGSVYKDVGSDEEPTPAFDSTLDIAQRRSYVMQDLVTVRRCCVPGEQGSTGGHRQGACRPHRNGMCSPLHCKPSACLQTLGNDLRTMFDTGAITVSKYSQNVTFRVRGWWDFGAKACQKTSHRQSRGRHSREPSSTKHRRPCPES